jgi:Pentapeptide repeats (9 copies)
LAKKCSYTTTYFDYDYDYWGEEERYECPDEEQSEGLCKFHLKRYAAADEKNKQELIEFLEQKVEDANAAGSPLKWIGYQIPSDFTISSEFKVNVYLDSANFIGDVYFFRSAFEGTASFSGAQFHGEASFIEAKFYKEARFDGTTFSEEADEEEKKLFSPLEGFSSI